MKNIPFPDDFAQGQTDDEDFVYINKKQITHITANRQICDEKEVDWAVVHTVHGPICLSETIESFFANWYS